MRKQHLSKAEKKADHEFRKQRKQRRSKYITD